MYACKNLKNIHTVYTQIFIHIHIEKGKLNISCEQGRFSLKYTY